MSYTVIKSRSAGGYWHELNGWIPNARFATRHGCEQDLIFSKLVGLPISPGRDAQFVSGSDLSNFVSPEFYYSCGDQVLVYIDGAPYWGRISFINTEDRLAREEGDKIEVLVDAVGVKVFELNQVIRWMSEYLSRALAA